jgi:hypothetical protein
MSTIRQLLNNNKTNIIESNGGNLLRLPSLTGLPSLNFLNSPSSSSSSSTLNGKAIKSISYEVVLTVIYQDTTFEKVIDKRQVKDQSKSHVLAAVKEYFSIMSDKIKNL